MLSVAGFCPMFDWPFDCNQAQWMKNLNLASDILPDLGTLQMTSVQPRPSRYCVIMWLDREACLVYITKPKRGTLSPPTYFHLGPAPFIEFLYRGIVLGVFWGWIVSRSSVTIKASEVWPNSKGVKGRLGSSWRFLKEGVGFGACEEGDRGVGVP